MGIYNLFTLDENGKPYIVSVKTDIKELENKIQFDEFIQAMPAEWRRQYFKEIANNGFVQVTIEQIDKNEGR